MNRKDSSDVVLSDRLESADNCLLNTSNSSISRLLYLLLQAHEYARELNRDVWDFAVGLPDLKDAKINSSDIRWALCKGFAIHARETTSAGDSARSFQEQNHLAVRKRSCFVLTNAGVAFIQKGATEVSPRGSGELDGPNAQVGPNEALDLSEDFSMVPKWDCARQELRLGPHVVKVFKLHSPNQAAILGTFEEEGWPTRIDDPLPPHREIEPKQRLHDTIKSLNRNQVSSLMRFRGDGTGQGVRWELHTLPFDTVRQQLSVAGLASSLLE